MAGILINEAALAPIRISFSGAFAKGFDGAKPAYAPITTIVPSANETNLYAWMGQFPQMREWTGDRVIKNIREYGYQVVNKDYEATIAVPRNKILDDVWGIYTPMMEEMGFSAAMHPDEIVFGLLANGAAATSLCYDGKAFFASNHPSGSANTATSNYDSVTGASNSNLWALLDTRRPLKPVLLQKRQEYTFRTFVDTPENIHNFMRKEFLYGVDARLAGAYGLWQTAYGSVGDLNSTNVQSYVQTMMAIKSDQDKPLNIKPNVCVVGPSNWAAARALFLTPTLTGGAANPNYGLCDVVQSAYLT